MTVLRRTVDDVTTLRTASEAVGRMVALVAVLFGFALVANLLRGGHAGWVLALLVTAGLCAIAGGVLFLLGLNRWQGRRGVRARAVGWSAFTLVFLLPTSLAIPLLVGSLAAAPTIGVWGTGD